MLVAVLVLVCSSSVIAFALWLRRKLPIEEHIFALPPTESLEWSRVSGALHMGDAIGDDFLDEVGQAAVYQANSIIELASSSGPAGKCFHEQFVVVPSWVDMALVEAGTAFLRRWIDIFGVTGIGTIIESYGYSDGANILMGTGRLCCASDATRRLLETGIFNLDIIEHGLDGSKSCKGVEAVARVRMLHCMVRRHVRLSCPWWQESAMGVPVNQEDGAHTVFLNSLASLRGMEMMGLPISSDEKNAVSMYWAYFGYLMGISEKFLAKSYNDELILYHTIFNRSFHPPDASYKLTNATLEALSGLPPYYFDRLSISTLARISLGQKLSQQMQVPNESSRWKDSVLVSLLKTTVVIRWFLYTYLCVYWNGLSYLRWTVDLAMKFKGYDTPKYRLLLVSSGKKGVVDDNN